MAFKNGGTKTSVKRIEATERARQALELRKAGATFEQIAQKCGYKRAQHAHKVVTAAIRAIPREAAEEVRKLELERLDRMTLALWQRAGKGDTEAINHVLKIMGRRAKLLGLDVPAADMSRAGPTQPIKEIVFHEGDDTLSGNDMNSSETDAQQHVNPDNPDVRSDPAG